MGIAAKSMRFGELAGISGNVWWDLQQADHASVLSDVELA
jgi:hypothetical protein